MGGCGTGPGRVHQSAPQELSATRWGQKPDGWADGGREVKPERSLPFEVLGGEGTQRRGWTLERGVRSGESAFVYYGLFYTQQ